MDESTASACAPRGRLAVPGWLHLVKRVARTSGYGSLPRRIAATFGRHGISWILCQDGLHSLHGDVKFDALNVDFASENDSPLDAQLEVHH